MAKKIIITGVYNGKNLLVQNPFGSSGLGFCVTGLLVNGKTTKDETQGPAFEIDFKPHNLKLQDPVTVTIKHKDDCMPKILNPEALKPETVRHEDGI